MRQKVRKLQALLSGVTAAGLLLQSSCPLQEDFDPVTLFAEVTSTVFTDSLFFALDSFLFSIS